MTVRSLQNKIKNHSTLYENFCFDNKSKVIVFDEPFGLKLLLKTWIKSYFSPYHLIIHNSNTWLDIPKYRMGKSLIFTLKRCIRKSLMRRKQGLIVVAKFLKHYLEQNGEVNVKYLPFIKLRNYHKSTESKSENILVIPGSVSPLKRYEKVLIILEKYPNIDTVVFLGEIVKGYVHEFSKFSKSLKENTKCEVITFSKRVDELEFDNYMAKGKICFIDFERLIKTNEGYTEIFGESKESGTFWLAAKYNIPLIAPITRNDINGLCTIKLPN